MPRKKPPASAPTTERPASPLPPQAPPRPPNALRPTAGKRLQDSAQRWQRTKRHGWDGR